MFDFVDGLDRAVDGCDASCPAAPGGLIYADTILAAVTVARTPPAPELRL